MREFPTITQLIGDTPINQLHIEIDSRCFKLLALYQPMAVDLRGFGAFSVKQRGARVGRNPRTGEAENPDERMMREIEGLLVHNAMAVGLVTAPTSMATWLNRQNPDVVSVRAWCPGGLVAQKPTRGPPPASRASTMAHAAPDACAAAARLAEEVGLPAEISGMPVAWVR